MDSSSTAAAVLFIFCLLTNSVSSSQTNLQKTNHLLFSSSQLASSQSQITSYFQVTKPIKLPSIKPCASLLVLQHDFGNTYGKSPVLVNYKPPSNCPSSQKGFSRIVLEWESTAKGRHCRSFHPVSAHQFFLFFPWKSETPLTKYFEVTKPIKIPPKAKPCASLLVLQHGFGYTYGKSPALVNYKPPRNCPSLHFSRIILEWESAAKGTQFDRIFGIWLSGVEIFRSCTAEPTPSGIIWTVQKDITRYTSLLIKPQSLAVYLGNIVDSTYTAVYHANLTFHFYPLHHKSPSSVDNPADLIMPISINLPLNDGLWFLVQNSTDIQSKKFTIPRNSYRAVLEVYVSFHSNDEFWYAHPPNEYIKAYNLTGMPANGPFREVVVRLNGDEIGAVWPFIVVFTGGFNPSIWSPITGIGSFDLPSYDIEITPFLGKMLDGKQHEFGFGVTNALNEWYVDANLHIWLDHKSDTTTGKLKKGSYITRAIRSISMSGWVNSSHGNITTNSFQDFSFTNIMTLHGSSEIVNQMIDASSRVYAIIPSSSSYIYTIERYQNFPLSFHGEYVPLGHGIHTALSYVSLGFNEKRLAGSSSSPWVSSVLNNSQQGQGVQNYSGSLVTGALGSIQQVYYLNGSVECYFWNASSSDGTILYNISGDPCQPKRQFNLGFESIRVICWLCCVVVFVSCCAKSSCLLYRKLQNTWRYEILFQLVF
ncbi:hypothetical protein MKW98_011653 [Papaver atlanticum]|uniref:Peptide N-acetyl-beta-D-glucosaminyl asparaginase amidase A N-terminal domain-containing protein n=1 Tax=Papaver atlanticum TaxID=357466 RepID=A0AAD4S8X9_9MAGN|nr:hypothetical protein MKW98_011653 [Papaver atlanticum]